MLNLKVSFPLCRSCKPRTTAIVDILVNDVREEPDTTRLFILFQNPIKKVHA